MLPSVSFCSIGCLRGKAWGRGGRGREAANKANGDEHGGEKRERITAEDLPTGRQARRNAEGEFDGEGNEGGEVWT